MKKLRTVYCNDDMEVCSECGSWIDEGEDVYEDDNGDSLCEDCSKMSTYKPL